MKDESRLRIDPAITRNRQRAIAQNRCYRGNTKHAYSDEFYTPAHIPAALGPFDLDPCAGPSKHARRNIRRPKNGLAAKWRGRIWMNPPYSRLEDWLSRFVQHGNGIALVNARPDAAWFQEFAAGASALLFLRGRTKFTTPGGDCRHPPVGSVLIAYGRGTRRPSPARNCRASSAAAQSAQHDQRPRNPPPPPEIATNTEQNPLTTVTSDAARTNQVYRWILEGASEFDINEAMQTAWPEADRAALILAALGKIRESNRTDAETVRGFCFEATRDLYRRMVEIGDFPGPCGRYDNFGTS